MESYKLAQESYKGSAEKSVNGWTLVEESPTLKIYNKGGRMIVAIRGTNDAEDVKADVLLGVNKLESSSRFQKDKQFLEDFQRRNPQYEYEGVGHSLGGAVLDLFLRNGMIKKGTSFNPAIQPRDFNQQLSNRRIFMEGDPLYNLAKPFLKQKPEVINENIPWWKKAARFTPLGNVLTGGEYLQAHGLGQFEGKVSDTELYGQQKHQAEGSQKVHNTVSQLLEKEFSQKLIANQ